MENKALQVSFETKEIWETIHKLEDEDRDLQKQTIAAQTEARDLEKRIMGFSLTPEQAADRKRQTEANLSAISSLKATLGAYQERFINH
jgi:predicted  nucleic acid-binding Zn-ribbon protein